MSPSEGELDPAAGSFASAEGLPPRSRRIHHLLVVAGPSAVGKTTFLRRLAHGELPTELTRVLPAGAANWAQIEAWLVPNWLRSQPLRDEVDGLVLHYDLWRLRNPMVVRPDPALSIVALASTATVVTLTSSMGRIIPQLARRTQKRIGGRRPPNRTIIPTLAANPRLTMLALTINLAAALPRSAASRLMGSEIVARLWGEFGASTLSRHVVEAFAASLRPGWLRRLHEDWLAMLDEILPGRSEVIELDPDVASPTGPFEWRTKRAYKTSKH